MSWAEKFLFFLKKVKIDDFQKIYSENTKKSRNVCATLFVLLICYTEEVVKSKLQRSNEGYVLK